MSSKQQVAGAFRKANKTEEKVEVAFTRFWGWCGTEPFTKAMVRSAGVYFGTLNGKDFYLTMEPKESDSLDWEWF